MQRIRHADAVQRVGEQCVEHFAGKGSKARFVGHDLAGQAQGQVGAAVVAAGESNHARALGVGAGDFDGVLHRFGASGQQQAFLGKVAGRQAVEAFADFHIGLVSHHLEAGVGVKLQLGLDRVNDGWVQVPGIQHGNAAGKVDVAATLHVPEFGIAGVFDEDFMGLAYATRDGGVAAGQ